MTKKKLLISLLLGIVIMTFTTPAVGKRKLKYLRQGTSEIGGTYYVFGGGVSAVINKYVEGVNLTPIPTTGTFECIQLLKKGAIDFAQLVSSSAYQAYNGIGRYKGKKPYKGLRVITAFYGGPHHYFVREDSPIVSLRDLKGKRIGSGPPGQQDYESAEVLLGAYGYDPKKDVKLLLMGKKDRCEALSDGRIDVAFIFVGLRAGMLTELTTTHKVRLLPIEEQVLEKITKELPYYVKGVIPAGTYRGQEKDVKTMWINSALACNDTLDEELVYKYTKAYWEHFDDIVRVLAIAKQVPTPTRAMEIGSFGMPFHPGAERYYREIGVLK